MPFSYKWRVHYESENYKFVTRKAASNGTVILAALLARCAIWTLGQDPFLFKWILIIYMSFYPASMVQNSKDKGSLLQAPKWKCKQLE